MSERLAGSRARLPRVRIGAIIAVALAVGFVVWLLVRGNDNSSSTSTTTTRRGSANGPIETTPAELRALAADLGHADLLGRARAELHVRADAHGRWADLRPLSPGRHADRDPSGRLHDRRDVPVRPRAQRAGALSKKPGEKTVAARRGGFAVYNSSTPTNVYLAYPGSNLQIEVYDPSPARARQLVSSGQVAPVR